MDIQREDREEVERINSEEEERIERKWRGYTVRKKGG